MPTLEKSKKPPSPMICVRCSLTCRAIPAISGLRCALGSPTARRFGDQENEDDQSRDNRLRSNAITGWQFDENIPAIVHPILQRKPRSSRQEVTNLEAVDWMVIVLNFNTIRNRIFPELTRRYFAGGQGLD